MKTHSPSNERIKRQYFGFLKEAKRHSEDTVDAVAKALARFEADTHYRDFKTFHYEQANAFKRRLAEQDSQATGEKLSQATRYATLAHLKRFFQWLAGQPGYKSQLQYSDAEYFNLSSKDTRVATARREKSVPTIEQVKHVLATMPADTDINRRNRALIAFTLLTGARDSAIASVKLKHVDLVAACVNQDAREVQTKNSKTFTTYFLPVGDDVLGIVTDWVRFLREEQLWGNDDPLFPATRIAVGETRQFEAAGLKRAHWSSATPIRVIFQKAFAAAGLPYFNPHSFRKTLVQLGLDICLTPEQFKAWSQNIGHESVLTTFYSYGEVAQHRQGEIIRSLANAKPVDSRGVEELVRAVVQAMRKSEPEKEPD